MSREAWRSTWIGALHIVVIVVLGIIDYLLGPEIELRPLYLAPVLTCALWAGAPAAVATAVAAGLAVILADDLVLVKKDINPLTIALALARILTFIAVALLVARVRTQRRALAREAAIREEYVGLVAHELRNPLVAIRAAAGRMARHPENADVARTARSIADEALAGSVLLDDLTEFALSEGQQMPSVFRRIDLARVVRSTAGAFSSEDHAIEIEGGDHRVVVLGDERRLSQVIRNLMSNAVKFSPRGTPIGVRVGVTPSAKDAVVAFRDHGPGIPPSERGRLFQRFARLSTAGTTRGTGLGLFISRRIARDHGGDVMVVSPPDGGSEFLLTIPLARAAIGSNVEDRDTIDSP